MHRIVIKARNDLVSVVEILAIHVRNSRSPIMRYVHRHQFGRTTNSPQP